MATQLLFTKPRFIFAAFMHTELRNSWMISVVNTKPFARTNTLRSTLDLKWMIWLHPVKGYDHLILRVRFFNKIQDWILKSERIRKWILGLFAKRIDPRSFGSRCVKGTEESTSRVDSSVPLTYSDPRDLGLICLVKKRKIRFQILSVLRILS